MSARSPQCLLGYEVWQAGSRFPTTVPSCTCGRQPRSVHPILGTVLGEGRGGKERGRGQAPLTLRDQTSFLASLSRGFLVPDLPSFSMVAS